LGAAEKETFINPRGGLYEVGTDHRAGRGRRLPKIFIGHDVYVKITGIHKINYKRLFILSPI
jgi:hypothetical protein